MFPGKDFIGIGCWGLILNDKDEILLIRKKGKDFWERPGGKVEFGETLQDALKREVTEEIGIDIEVDSYLNCEEVLDENTHWLAFAYLAKHVSGEIKNLEPHKHEEIQWFAISSLPKVSAHTKLVIDKFINGPL